MASRVGTAAFDRSKHFALALLALALTCAAPDVKAADPAPSVKVMTPSVPLAAGGKGIDEPRRSSGSYRHMCAERGERCEPKECNDADIPLTGAECVTLGDDTLCERWCAR